MVHSSPKSRTLSAKLSKRERFLKKVVSFVEKLVQKKGRILEINQGSSNTNVVRELLDFGNFSFKTDLGQTMFGGNDIEVWYHPGTSFRNRKRFNTVLSVYYQCFRFETDDCRVNTFDESHGWQLALNNAIRNEKKILVDMERKKRDARQRSLLIEKRENERDKKKAKMTERAERLGL